MIPLKDQTLLLKLARDSISSHFTKKPYNNHEIEKRFMTKQGVFVTLKKAKELKGCIGYSDAFFTLYDGIKQAAKSAAFEDPRFPQLTKEELDVIQIEISVLTEPKLIEVKNFSEYLDVIELGKHGLLIKSDDGKNGLLLPQVPIEHGWDTKEFLQFTCEKAGLPFDAWTKPETKIYSFECEIFSE